MFVWSCFLLLAAQVQGEESFESETDYEDISVLVNQSGLTSDSSFSASMASSIYNEENESTSDTSNPFSDWSFLPTFESTYSGVESEFTESGPTYFTTEGQSYTPAPPSPSPDELDCVSDNGTLQIYVSDREEYYPGTSYCVAHSTDTDAFDFSRPSPRNWTGINITLFTNSMLPFNFKGLSSNLSLSVRSNDTTVFHFRMDNISLFGKDAFQFLVFDNVNVSISPAPTEMQYPLWGSLQFLHQTDVDWSSWYLVDLSRVRNIEWGTYRLQRMFTDNQTGPLGNLSQADEYVFGEGGVGLVNGGVTSENISESFSVILKGPVTFNFATGQHSINFPINFYIADGVPEVNLTIGGDPPPNVSIALMIGQRNHVSVTIYQDFLPLNITGSGKIHVNVPPGLQLRARPISVRSGSMAMNSSAKLLNVSHLSFLGWSNFSFNLGHSESARLLEDASCQAESLTVSVNSSAIMETGVSITNLEIGENSNLTFLKDSSIDVLSINYSIRDGISQPLYFVNCVLTKAPSTICFIRMNDNESEPLDDFNIICGSAGLSTIDWTKVSLGDSEDFHSVYFDTTTNCVVASVKSRTEEAKATDGNDDNLSGVVIAGITVAVVAVVMIIITILVVVRNEKKESSSFSTTTSSPLDGVKSPSPQIKPVKEATPLESHDEEGQEKSSSDSSRPQSSSSSSNSEKEFDDIGIDLERP